MRILHALSQTELTGSEVYAYELSQLQVKEGCEVFVASDRLHKDFPGIYLQVRLSASGPRRITNILFLRRWIKQNSIDLVHCHSRGACRHFYWVLWGLKIPMITTLHGFQHSSFSKKLFDIYGDWVTVVSRKIRDQLVRDFHVNPHKIEVLPNPVTVVAGTAPADPQGAGHLTDHPAGRLAPRLALAGRASGPKGKRLLSLLRSQLATWRKLFPNLQVELYLSGLQESERQNLANAFTINVQGTVADLGGILRQCSVVVASGRIAVEALLQGTQVLVLGEAQYMGPIQQQNLVACFENNFGDVGPSEPIPFARVTEDLASLLRSNKPPDEALRRQLQEHFSSAKVVRRFFEIYRAAILLKRSPALSILMYHKVLPQTSNSPHRIFVTTQRFEQHLKFFKKHGFTALHFQDLSDFWWGRRPVREFPKKPVILTFDDGYRNNLTFALPLLEKYGVKATIFALADNSVTHNSWDEGDELLLTPQEIKALPPSLIEIGSHGLRHERLPGKSDTEILTDLTRSKSLLEGLIGRTVRVFAYPFGDIDERLPRLAEQSGYEFAVNTDRGPEFWAHDRWSLFRVNIFPEDGPFSLWKKTAKWYRGYYLRKRGH
ncbi:MAG: hypothetical protein C5B49_10985 [Bdellovibrio sp.]|nr:MAG: hypothetical protein C5B49_10985 [Bdellovibrio sp.]